MKKRLQAPFPFSSIDLSQIQPSFCFGQVYNRGDSFVRSQYISHIDRKRHEILHLTAKNCVHTCLSYKKFCAIYIYISLFRFLSDNDWKCSSCQTKIWHRKDVCFFLCLEIEMFSNNAMCVWAYIGFSEYELNEKAIYFFVFGFFFVFVSLYRRIIWIKKQI